MDVNYDSKYAWADYSESIKIHKVKGEHSTIFDEKHSQELSTILQQYLDDNVKYPL